MNTVGMEKVGECKYDMLIADATYPVDVCSVKIATDSKATDLKKGTVLTIESDGTSKVLAAEATGTAAYILAEDVTTSASGPVIATAYQTGKFIKDSIIVGSGYSLSVSDVKSLRDAGIYLENMMK